MNENFFSGLAIALLDSLGIGNKVSGNRNWVLKTRDNTVEGGRPSHFPRYFFSARLSDIGEHGITWRYFTYKKDFDTAIQAYRDAGYKIWIS